MLEVSYFVTKPLRNLEIFTDILVNKWGTQHISIYSKRLQSGDVKPVVFVTGVSNNSYSSAVTVKPPAIGTN
jgi:hypothetical protein